MSSDAKELKGGHPPAVKAGGMRIASKAHPHTHHNLTPEQKLEDKKFMEEEHILENCEEKPPSKVLVSGAEVKLTDASNPGSVKQFHDKPQPKVEKPVKHHHQHAIQQPRKQ
ncbi:death-associated protein 1-like [Xenia sp. Carnegie-2017]|uniref:death-associated protein 1-like n=1 Tax=Xenia sp. Carnegie-2017 TaxID=2897299 RepID=UPI001F03CA37|nr:death-associated protein 1-like [Xenia sp. Carnegie-2017]